MGLNLAFSAVNRTEFLTMVIKYIIPKFYCPYCAIESEIILDSLFPGCFITCPECNTVFRIDFIEDNICEINHD